MISIRSSIAFALAATALLAGCSSTDTTEPTQVTLPIALDNTASGIAVRPNGSIIVGEIGMETTFDRYSEDTNSDSVGRILELAADGTTTDVLAAPTPAPVLIALRDDNLYVGELNRISEGESSSFDDQYGFQVRVFRNGASEVIPLDIKGGETGSMANNAVHAMAVAPSGDIYVCTSWSDLSSSDDLLRLPKGAATPVAVTQQTSCSDGLAVNSKGDLYALEGDVMFKFPHDSEKPAGVWMPAVIRPARFTIGPDDSIYVVDNGSSETGQRVVRFTDGATDATIVPFVGTVHGYHDIAVAENGDILLTDDDLVYRLPAD